MREVTRVLTLDITQIEIVENDDDGYNFDQNEFNAFAAALRDVLEADNVSISNIKYFEREVKDGEK